MKKRKVYTISILSFLLSLACSTGYFIDNVKYVSEWNNLDFILWALCVFILSFILKFFIEAISEKFKICIDNIKPVNNIYSVKYGFIAFGVILLCYTVVWLAYYPGFWNYDPWQVNQALFGEFFTGHPLIHTLLLSGCYLSGLKANDPNLGLVIYVWIQMLFLASIFAYICKYILINTRSIYIYILSIFFYAIFPFNSLMAISTTKDVIFSGLLVMFIILSYRLLDSQPSRRITGCFLFVGTLMLLFRNNAAYAYILWLICAFFGMLKKIISKKVYIILILLFCLYLICDRALIAITNAGIPSAPTAEASIPSMQMGRLYFQDYADKDDIAIISKYVDLDKATYIPAIADSMIFNLKVEDKKELMEMFFSATKLFFKYPRVTIDAVLCLHKGSWYIGDKSYSEIYGKGLDRRQGYMPTDIKNGYGIVPNSKIPRLEKMFERLFSNNEYQENPILFIIFSPAFYNWILIGCLLYYIYKKKYRELIAASVLLCLVITIILGPCTLVRYSYPIIISSPLLISWLINKNSDMETKVKSEEKKINESKDRNIY